MKSPLRFGRRQLGTVIGWVGRALIRIIRVLIRAMNPPRPLASKRVDLISNKLIKIKEKKPPLSPLQGPRGGVEFVCFSVSPVSGIVAGQAEVILEIRALRPKIEPPTFVFAALYGDWTPGVFSKTARKRQIGPNGLLASTARTFSNTCVFPIFCSFRLYVVIGALPAPSLHQNELFASTACTFSKHVILTSFVKTQPYVVIGAPLPIS